MIYGSLLSELLLPSTIQKIAGDVLNVRSFQKITVLCNVVWLISTSIPEEPVASIFRREEWR
jgi:hypothetical protein